MTSTCPSVIGSGAAMKNGSEASVENALKKRTISAPFTRRIPSSRTHVYATPAPSPPPSAQTVANVAAP